MPSGGGGVNTHPVQDIKSGVPGVSSPAVVSPSTGLPEARGGPRTPLHLLIGGWPCDLFWPIGY